MVAENKWVVDKEKTYKYMLVHEFQGKEDKFATIRLHLYNNIEHVKQEMWRYTYSKTRNNMLKSETVESVVPIENAKAIVEHTIKRKSVF